MLELKRQGKTVFFSTHVIADVEEVCDRVAIINAGTLQEVYCLEDILRDSVVGYSIQISDCSADVFTDFNLIYRGDGRMVANVSKELFKPFTERLFVNGEQIEFIEAQRRSLETLFLEVVHRKS